MQSIQSAKNLDALCLFFNYDQNFSKVPKKLFILIKVAGLEHSTLLNIALRLQIFFKKRHCSTDQLFLKYVSILLLTIYSFGEHFCIAACRRLFSRFAYLRTSHRCICFAFHLLITFANFSVTKTSYQTYEIKKRVSAKTVSTQNKKPFVLLKNSILLRNSLSFLETTYKK